jgi:hypothetical protein
MDSLLDKHIARYKTNILTAIGLPHVHPIGLAYFLQPTLLPGMASVSEREKTTIEHNRDREWETLTGLIIESTGDQLVAQGRSRVEEVRLNASSLEHDTGSK